MSEKNLAQKWLVNFTPTVVFFSPDDMGAVSQEEAEAFRLPGYFKPFHYATSLEYVMSGSYKDTGFQRFTSARFVRLAAEGKNPTLWD